MSIKPFAIRLSFVALGGVLLVGSAPLRATAPRHPSSAIAPSSTELIQAAKDDDRVAARNLIAKHVDVNAAQGDGFTALHWAAYNDDVELTKLLLAHGASPEPRTRLEGNTPLFLAAGNGDTRLVDALLAGGAKISTTNDNGTTLLMQAAAAGEPSVILDLLARGANVNDREKAYGQTALFFAASRNRPDAVRVLTQHGADTSIKTTVKKLERITVNADGEEVPQGKAGADGAKPQDADGDGNAANAKASSDAASSRRRGKADQAAPVQGQGAPILATLQSGSVDTKDGLTDAAPKKDEADAYGFTRADRAARVYGSQTMGGLTALQVAARDGQLDAVKALLDAHADINAQTETDKSTPLLLALINGHYDLAKYLIDHQADVKLVSTDGLGPLYAVIDVQWAPHTWYPQPVVAQEKSTYQDVLNDLLAHGADVNAKLTRKLWFRVFANDETWVDVTGATPLWRAAYSGDLEVMKILADHGGDVNAASKSNDSPLMVAAGLGWAAYWTQNAPSSRLDVVKFCLDHGANINLVDIKGYTAIHGAAFRGDNKMIEYLLSRGADLKVTSKSGDTVADSANGLFEHATVHPDTVAMLEKLGSKSSNNCRSNECVVPPKADRPIVAGRAGGSGGRGGGGGASRAGAASQAGSASQTPTKPTSAPAPGDQAAAGSPEKK